MSVRLLTENLLDDDNFSSATEQEGERWGQPIVGTNTGKARLLSLGDPADFSYTGTTSGAGAAGGTTTVDSTMAAYGDDYFIGGTITCNDGANAGETQTITDFDQATGTFTHAAFTNQVAGGVSYTLTVAWETRDFRLEIITSGDVGDADFKWSHNGGTTYLGRDDPNQATWLNKDSKMANVHAPDNYHSVCAIKTADEEVMIFYLDNGDNQYLKCCKTSDNGVGISWGSEVTIASYEPDALGCAICLKSGRILVFHSNAVSWAIQMMSYSDDNGATWSEVYIATSSMKFTSVIEISRDVLLAADRATTGADGEVDVWTSTDGGFTWGSQTTVAHDANGQDNPCLIMAENGDIICAYETEETSAGDWEIKCKISSNQGASWGTVKAVMDFDSPNPGDEYQYCNLIKDINGRIYCFAEKTDDSDIYFTYSDDNGATWNSTTAIAAAADGADTYTWPAAVMTPNCSILLFYHDNTNNDIECVRRGIWEAYAANAVPCAIEGTNQMLMCGAEITWRGYAAIDGDTWSFTPEYYFKMENIIADSPKLVWRSTQDNADISIVIDRGTASRNVLTGVAFFGCNYRYCRLQGNDTDVWTAPTYDEWVCFDICSGLIDSISANGNRITDTSLADNYKVHELSGKFLVATSGTDVGTVWDVQGNDGVQYIDIDISAATNLAADDAFALFDNHTFKTFSGIGTRYLRIIIPAQQTSDNYYQIGFVLLGVAAELTEPWAINYHKDVSHNISIQRNADGDLVGAIKRTNRKRIFELGWRADETTRQEILALLNYCEGKNICLVPDDTDSDDGSELLSNTGFETAGGGDPDFFQSWTESAGDGTIADSATAHGGTHAAKLTCGASANTYIYQDISVTAGLSYLFSGWTRVDAADNDGIFHIYDVTHSKDISPQTNTEIDGVTYTEVFYVFTAPDGCSSVRVYLRPSATNGDVAYWDDISVTKLGRITDCYLVKHDGQVSQTQAIGDNFDIDIVLSEV